MKTLDEIKKIFYEDKFAHEAAGAVIEEAREGYSRCSFEIAPVHKNAAGGVMGGAIFTLADFAFAVAVNSEEMKTVSLSSSISYIGMAKGKRLIAEANAEREGRTTCVYTITIKDDLGNYIALVKIDGYRVK